MFLFFFVQMSATVDRISNLIFFDLFFISFICLGCTQIVTVDFNHHLDPPRRLLLQFLDVTDCYAIDDNGLKTIVQNCPQLVYLYLRRCTQITGSFIFFLIY